MIGVGTNLRWFWIAVADHLWQTTLVLLVLLLLARVLRHGPARMLQALWWLGIVKLFLPLPWLGPIVGDLAWTQAVCDIGTWGMVGFDLGEPPPGRFYYFVVVGQNLVSEGSYGHKRIGPMRMERPEAEAVGTCDQPQVLGGVCP